VARFLERAPHWVLRRVAERNARVRPLGLQPGWYFGLADEDTSREAAFRRELSMYFRDEHIRDPIVVRWYEGLKLRLYLGTDMGHCLYVGGSFEPNEFAFLSTVLRPGMVFLDGGANDGLYSLYAAGRVGDKGRVIAIEPSSREYKRLLANLRLNRIGNVEAVGVALGDTPGSAVLAIAEDGHEGQNTIGQRVSNPTVETRGHETVRVETIDGLVDERALERVDVLKLDVEGSESRALAGARTTIEHFQPLLQIEVEKERLASQHTTKDVVLELLDSVGYRPYVFDSRTGQLRPPTGPEEPEGNVVAGPAAWHPVTL
jgi:FkbM family methyltransferase